MMVTNNKTRVRVPNQSSQNTNTDSPELYDASSPNPTGRDAADDSASMKGKLRQCKNTIHVSTMNVRTIRQPERREELVQNFSAQDIEILGFQEHRIVHEEPTRYERILGKTLITTPAWRNSAGAATGGVGILLNTKATKCLANVTSHTERILVPNFTGNPAATIIVTYSPTNSAEDSTIHEYYESLRRAIDSVPTHNVLIILGDFNAHVGIDDGTFGLPPIHQQEWQASH